MRPDRLNTIVDCVFAIAMSLIALDLPHPGVSKELVDNLEDPYRRGGEGRRPRTSREPDGPG
jgi:hypothetical protein